MTRETIIEDLKDVSVGKRLKAWRKSAYMTLADVSRMIAVSQSSLSEMENEKSLPSAKTLQGLCSTTDLNICWLLTGQGPMRKSSAESHEAADFPEELSNISQDPKLKDLARILVRIYRQGGPEKRAHIAGFLQGADMDRKVGEP
ncbi:MAG: helix-turn-helix transcriptional regulator [Nitrospinae bacterium]|nr:helix-turn-helix transcriptional regulator [Nitrospinota bacterium]